jgi:hypothetical protein
MQLPDHDFWLLLHLVPERMQTSDEGCAALGAMAGHLEAGKFKEFWAAASTPAAVALTGTAPGFEACARAFIARSLGCAYRSLSAAVLAEALRMEASALPAWLATGPATAGWSLEEGGSVVRVPRSEANDPQPQKGAETIPFSKLEGLFKSVKA